MAIVVGALPFFVLWTTVVFTSSGYSDGASHTVDPTTCTAASCGELGILPVLFLVMAELAFTCASSASALTRSREVVHVL